MLMPIHAVVLGERDRTDMRRRALERLYMRKAAVDDLIRSLEHYQKTQRAKAPCIPFNEARKCS
jgi:hypothetical protein